MTSAITPVAAAVYPPAKKAPPPPEPSSAETRDPEAGRTSEVKLQRLLARLDARLLYARLVIEQDDDLGDYVYKLVDDKTGQVEQRWPRQTLMEMIREMTPRNQTAVLFDVWA